MKVKELRNELISVFNNLKKGEIKQSDAKEFANVAGKIISTAKLEIEYNKIMGTKSKIDFLEV